MRSVQILFSVIILITTFLIFLPVVLNWRYDRQNDEDDSNSLLVRAISSEKYHESLVANMSISAVLLIDVLLEIMYSTNKSCLHYLVPRGALLLVTAIPDVITYFLITHSAHEIILVILFQIRFCSIFFVGFFTACYLKSKLNSYLVVAFVSIEMSAVLRCWLSFPIINYDISNISFFILFSIAILLFLKLSISSYYDMISIPSSERSNDIIIIYIILSSFFFFGIGNILFLAIFGPAIHSNSTSLYLCLHSYSYVILNISIWLRFGSIFRVDVAQTKASLDTKRVFVRYISHEIRTPLNTMLMGIKLMKQKEKQRTLNKKLFKEVTGEMELSCDAAITILNGLLDYEKIEAGLMKLDKTKISAWPFLRDSIRPFRMLARQAGIELSIWNEQETQEALSCCMIDGDINKLCQIIRNFVSNAIKFTPRGGAVIIKASFATGQARPRYASGYVSNAWNVARAAALVRSNYPVLPRASWSLAGSVNSNDRERSSPHGSAAHGASVRSFSHTMPRVYGGNASDSVGSHSNSNSMRVPRGRTSITEERRAWTLLGSGGDSSSGYNSRTVRTSGWQRPGGRRSDMEDGPSVREVFSRISPAADPDISSNAPYVYAATGTPTLRIEIIDTGYGLSPENLRRVFNEIVQFNSGELQNGGGSGLSLWISKSLAEMHGGSVSAYSAGEGRGCTFTLELPAIFEPAKMLSAVISAGESDNNEVPIRESDEHYDEETSSGDTIHDVMLSEASSLSNLDILIVDDVALTRKMMCRLLGSICKAVHDVSDGLLAVKYMKDKMNNSLALPDVILIDFIMPHMDGPTATKEIRTLGYKGLIIGVTGNALPADVAFFLAQGVDRVLVKPLRVELLENTITELIRTV